MAIITDYRKFEQGKTYMDNFICCLWMLEEKTDKGAILRKIPSEKGIGVKMTVEPDTTRMSFYPM